MESIKTILGRHQTRTLENIIAAHTNSSNGGSESDSRKSSNKQKRKGPQPETPRECICKGLGWYGYDVDIEHPFFGRVFPCRCKVEETMGRYKQWLWGDCGLPADYVSVSLTDFRPTTTANRRAAEAAVQYLTGELPTQWLIYQGSYGCGKTHLLAAIVRGFVLQGVHARYVSTAAALENLKEQMGRGGGAFHDVYLSLKRIPVLAVDDLGIEYSTEWARETIEELIDYRYREAMPTVVGTNLRLDEFHPRLRSRLKDDLMCTLVINDSPDYRETHRSSRGGLADAR